MASLDLCSTQCGVRWRDAGRAFSVFKPVKKKSCHQEILEEGGLFSLGEFRDRKLSTDVSEVLESVYASAGGR